MRGSIIILFVIGLTIIANAQRSDTTNCYMFNTSLDSSFIRIVIHDYNEDNNLLLETAHSWDNGWSPDEKGEFTYDANDNNISVINYNWDSNINDWVGDKKNEYTYDLNNNKTSRIYTDWSSASSSWINSNKYEYTYDVNNNQVLEIQYRWDYDNSIWGNYSKYEHSYDVNNNRILSIEYLWDSNINDWKIFSKYEYTYDINSIVELRIYYTWDISENDWNIASGKREYTNDNENVTNYINYDWDISSSNWIPISKKDFAYDVNNNLILDADYNWDSNSNAWVGGMTKIEYAYDAFNNKILITLSEWQSNNWFAYYKCYTNVDYSPQEVYIPDENFLAALVSHNPIIDENGDGLIQTTEAENVTGIILVPSQNISDLTGIEAFENITGLDCSQNQITELDLSNNTALESIICNDNILMSLNVANGNNNGAKSFNNITITNENFHAENNPDLFCIQVDNPNWSTANWTNVDVQSYFHEDCSMVTVSEIPIANFSVYPNPTTGIMSVEGKNIDIVEINNIKGQVISKQKVNQDITKINIKNYPKGIYIIRVINNKETLVKKIIKQ